MEATRIYADTSVFGGVYDDEFREPSRILFEQVKRGHFILITSAVVQAEMVVAPATVRTFLEAEIVTPKYINDALHVALATVAQAALIVSWNF